MNQNRLLMEKKLISLCQYMTEDMINQIIDYAEYLMEKYEKEKNKK